MVSPHDIVLRRAFCMRQSHNYFIIRVDAAVVHARPYYDTAPTTFQVDRPAADGVPAAQDLREQPEDAAAARGGGGARGHRPLRHGRLQVPRGKTKTESTTPAAS